MDEQALLDKMLTRLDMLEKMVPILVNDTKNETLVKCCRAISNCSCPPSVDFDDYQYIKNRIYKAVLDEF